MNINGHEVERRGVDGPRWMYIDGNPTGWVGEFSPEWYADIARSKRAQAKKDLEAASQAELIAEFVRREAAEKAEQAAATELDRRADLARLAWFGPRGKNNALPWYLVAKDAQEDWRNLVRALDADTATRQADQAGEPS